jgi:cytoskeletal protein RodZ
MQSTEINESLGHFLKRSREERNVSIEQVAYATRISLKMLRALEEDDHTALPAATFVRGYLQAYAKYVRIDTQDLLLRYQHHLATAPDAKRGAIRSHYLYVRERYQEKRRLVLVIVLFATMLAVAGTYFFLKSQREKRKHLAKTAELIQKGELAPAIATVTSTDTSLATSTKTADAKSPADLSKTETKTETKIETKTETKAETKAAAPTPPPPPPEAKAPVVAPPPPAPAPVPAADGQKKNHTLTLKANEDVWFRYQTDSDEVKDLTLRAGKTMVLRADKVVKIFSGNLNAMKATLNGQELAALAKATGVKSVVLPESEAANHPLPLFPQFQTKTQATPSAAPQKAPAANAPAPAPSNPTTPPESP